MASCRSFKKSSNLLFGTTLLLVGVLFSKQGHSIGIKATTEYDVFIEKAAETYVPQMGCVRLKSQYYQESRLNPDARSPVGAEGIAQFMPGTFKEITKAMGYGLVSPRNAQVAIAAGAYYDRRLMKYWDNIPDQNDLLSITWASYNAGPGSLSKARKKANGSLVYEEIIGKLPEVTGKYSAETIGYVKHIWKYSYLLECKP